jgi:pyruvate/2-oxoacid:ferredoxin oxidoreductase beta subunit
MRTGISEQEIVSSGHLACAGCGLILAQRFVMKALGKKTIMVIPACCAIVVDGIFPYTSLDIPMMAVAFETTAAVTSGIKAALDIKGKKDVTVIGFAGDGGTFDIGIQALSSAAERNEDVIYICYDNEAYMNTGIQRSSATPYGSWTTTTPVARPKDVPKKNMMEILAAHRIPYCATACVAYPEDMIAKIKKAQRTKGFKFLHFISPCPPGWKMPTDLSITKVRQAVESRVFPMYEIHNGRKYNLTIEPEKKIPVGEYLSSQGRFAHLSKKEVGIIQKQVDFEWEELLRKIEQSKDL